MLRNMSEKSKERKAGLISSNWLERPGETPGRLPRLRAGIAPAKFEKASSANIDEALF
jgi:hypothetical protein